MPGPLVSIVILTSGRETLLRRCLESINAAAGSRNYEVLIIVNQHEGALPDDALGWLRSMRQVSVKRISPRYNGAARNAALPLVRGEWICFLDDDVEVDARYFSIAEELRAQFPEIDVFGGPDSTGEGAAPFQAAVGIAYASLFCMGHTRRRHTPAGDVAAPADERSLILCNLWVRAELLTSGIYKFPEQLNRNEENVLLAELLRAGTRMLYVPQLTVKHERKRSFRELWRPVFQSGANRFRSFFLEDARPAAVYFVPMLFVYYLAFLVLTPRPLFAAGLLAYAVLNLVFSILEARRAGRLQLAPLASAITFWIHLAYGMGSIFGAIRGLREAAGGPSQQRRSGRQAG